MFAVGTEQPKLAKKRPLTESLDRDTCSDVSNHNTGLFRKMCIDGTDYTVGETGKKVKPNAAKGARMREEEEDEDEGNIVTSRSSTSGSWAVSIPPAPDSAVGSTKPQPSRYMNIKPLGNGQFGRVILVKDTLMNMECAVKIVTSQKNALKEAKALSNLSHPNIVRYYDCWIQDFNSTDINDRSPSCCDFSSSKSLLNLYIKMEFCDSGNLKDLIENMNNSNLGCSERIKQSHLIIEQIASALEHMHCKDLFHRDLKPSNILVNKDQTVKIGDFGLAAMMDGISGGIRVERSPGVGTTPYMAPEQVSTDYDHKVDLFAVGLIWFECLWRVSTGHERVKIWPDLRKKKFPRGFENTFFEQYMIVKRLLCENPEERPEASELLSMLSSKENINESSSCSPQASYFLKIRGISGVKVTI